ncbi:MAG: beta strand repeat-containing protein, partial [Candidatus Kapaibacteriota bacterium]
NLDVTGDLGVTGNISGTNGTFGGNVNVTGDVIANNGAFGGNVSANTFTQNGFAVLDANSNFAAAASSDATVTGKYNSLDIQLKNGVVGTNEIANNAVTTAKIAPSGTNNQFLVTNNLGNTTWLTFNKSGKFTGDGVGTALDIAAGAITTTEIADGTVTSTDIADGTILPADVNLGASGWNFTTLSQGGNPVLTTATTFSNAAASDISVNGTYNTLDLQIKAGTVGSTEIADGSIVDADVSATAGIAGTKIVPNFGTQNIITTGDVSANNGAFGGNVSANTFTQNGFAVLDANSNFAAAASSDATVTGKYNSLDIQLKNGVVGTNEIANNAVTTAKIAPSGTNNQFLVTNNLGNTTWLTFNKSGKFTGDGVGTALDIAAGAIGTTELADLSVTTSKLADAAVTNSKIASGAVTANKISSGAAPATYVLKADGAGNATWQPDAITIPFNESYGGAGDMFTLTRTSGTDDIIVAINNGTGGNAGQFINGNANPDAALYARTNGTGYSFLAEKNTSAVGEYVAGIVNVNAGAGRGLYVESNTPTTWPYNSPFDFTDQDEATVVIRNTSPYTNPAPGVDGVIALKTYGDIVTNSAVIGNTIIGVDHVFVGDPTSGLYYDLQPPSGPGGPLDIYGTPGQDANVVIHGTNGVGVWELDVKGDARVSGTMSIGSATFGNITVTGTSDLQGSIVNTSSNNSGRVYVNDGFQVTGDSWFDGNNMTIGDASSDLLTINSTVSVVNSDILVGTGTFDHNSVNPDVYVTGNLEVDGTIYGNLQNSVTAGTGLTGGSFNN